MKAWLTLLALVGAAVFILGCGGGGDASGDATGAETAAEKSGDGEPGPEVVIPPGPPPKNLVVKEVKKGTGAVAKVGDEIGILYVGKRWTGENYSNAWSYGRIPKFELGIGPGHRFLSPGLDQGIRGMRVGGRRMVIVPPKLIYLPYEEHTGKLHPNETLVFIVDLKSVRPLEHLK